MAPSGNTNSDYNPFPFTRGRATTPNSGTQIRTRDLNLTHTASPTSNNNWFHGYAPGPTRPNTSSGNGSGGSGNSGTSSSTVTNGVKIATSNLFVLNDIPPSVEATFSLVFESLVASELVGYLRHDMVNGQSIKTDIFTNFSGLSKQYSPFDIIHLNGTSVQYSNNFSYHLENYIPSVGNGVGGDLVYIASTSSNVITIDLINITDNERVEVEFVTFDGVKNATMYS